jgi:hypothetical protein
MVEHFPSKLEALILISRTAAPLLNYHKYGDLEQQTLNRPDLEVKIEMWK